MLQGLGATPDRIDAPRSIPEGGAYGEHNRHAGHRHGDGTTWAMATIHASLTTSGVHTH
jgi:hypothetical protein